MKAPLCAGLVLAATLVAACSDGDPITTEGFEVPEPGPLAFTDVTADSGVDFRLTSGGDPPLQIVEVKGGGLALLDADGDGDLDLFAPNGATLARPEDGPGARLWENLAVTRTEEGEQRLDGELRFADVTAGSGIRFRRWGMGVAVGDANGDGREDLFVAAFGANALLLNQGDLRFSERTKAAGLTHTAWGAAAAFGDLDVDGDLDLYLANYLELDPMLPPPPTTFLGVEVFAGPSGLPAVADVLYENLGDGTFRDVTAESGCADVRPSYGLGAVVVDFDEDGLPEVFVGNDSMRNFLFANRGGLRFEDVGLASGLGSNSDGRDQATMGIALADVDGNGLVDVFTTNFASDSNTLHLNRGELLFDDRTQAYRLGMVSQSYLGWAAMFYDFDLDADEDLVVFNGHVYPEDVTQRIGQERRQAPLCFARQEQGFEALDTARAGAWLGEVHCDRAAAFGDLDLDGDVDFVVAELGGRLRVLQNDAPPGEWLVVELRDGSKNPRGLGSEVTVRLEDRELSRWIVSGAGFQSASDSVAYFGLPAGTSAVDVEVRWPDGETTVQTSVSPRGRVVVER